MIISRSEKETREAGAAMAGRLGPGDVVAIDGDLGAGKTAFVKGLASGLGYGGDVTSPTFPLAQEYLGGRFPMAHLDFYRIESEGELVRGGLDEYFAGDFVVAVEWAGKFPNLIPGGAIWVEIGVRDETGREIVIR
jgi:tRNA threonylcarbamoyladenosine biosynthesis protein TsaE